MIHELLWLNSCSLLVSVSGMDAIDAHPHPLGIFFLEAHLDSVLLQVATVPCLRAFSQPSSRASWKCLEINAPRSSFLSMLPSGGTTLSCVLHYLPKRPHPPQIEPQLPMIKTCLIIYTLWFPSLPCLTFPFPNHTSWIHLPNILLSLKFLPQDWLWGGSILRQYFRVS